jgi:hypothetical protein
MAGRDAKNDRRKKKPSPDQNEDMLRRDSERCIHPQSAIK